MSQNYSFGYPRSCSLCSRISKDDCVLRVAPHYREGGNLRVMLVGQDPTINKKPERVTEVLMLNENNGQLTRWLNRLFSEDMLKSLTLYATNLVKCSFSKPPSSTEAGGLRFLAPYFLNCQNYLSKEILTFQPHLVLAFGEPAHKLFITILDNRELVPTTMQKAFGKGELIKCAIKGFEFAYSPCLHIKTFRVAEVYGDSVQKFKSVISNYLDDNLPKEI